MEDLLKDLKNNNEKFSEEYVTLMKQYYEKMLKSETGEKKGGDPTQPDEEGGLVITPEKFCCIKCTDSTGQKVFINITHHEKIEAPKEEHILEMNNQLGVRLPLSLSEKYEDFDNKNQICQVYDVIFNTNVVKKAEKEAIVFQFMVQLICERIKQRFNHEVSTNFVKMKNLVYKGKYVRQQRVRVRTGPKIEEVLNPKTVNQTMPSDIGVNSREINKMVNEKGKTPNWSLIILKDRDLTVESFSFLCENNLSRDLIEKRYSLDSYVHNTLDKFYSIYDGSNAFPKHGQSLLYILEMNLLSKAVGINLHISDEGMVINCPKIYSLEISFPYRISSKESYSVFETEGRFLFIILPFYDADCMEYKSGAENDKKIENINLSDDYLYDLVV